MMTGIFEFIRNAYEVFEKLNISVTGLIVVMLVLSLAFLFAVREAASWFLKVDDLKRDLRTLREITTQLEGEIRVVQSLMSQAKLTSLNLVPATLLRANTDGSAALSTPEVATNASPVSQASAAPVQFPIIH